MMNIVLDTNCLLMSVSPKGEYYYVWRSFWEGEYVLCYTNDIIEEYEEILSQKIGKKRADLIINAILALPNTKQVVVSFKWNIIKNDPDDNKFVDCAVAANAKYIVTQDKHFNDAKASQFPKVNVLNLDEFMKVLDKNNKTL